MFSHRRLSNGRRKFSFDPQRSWLEVRKHCLGKGW
nr:MAG TPA: hypothetical protein [Caudoviricetes sp.]